MSDTPDLPELSHIAKKALRDLELGKYDIVWDYNIGSARGDVKAKGEISDFSGTITLRRRDDTKS